MPTPHGWLQRQWAAQHYARDKQSYKDRARRVAKEKREYVAAEKARLGCMTCGERDPVALDYHHRDPAQKLFIVSQGAHRYGWEKIKAEIAKCDVICASCHRKHHRPGGEHDTQQRPRPRPEPQGPRQRDLFG